MPFYEYLCKNCGHKLEELQSMKEEPLKKCPKCGKDTLQKLLGTGSSVIFKGSGFYKTDYKKKSSSSVKSDSSTESSSSTEIKSESKIKSEKKKK